MSQVIVTKDCPKCGKEPFSKQLKFGFNLFCPTCGLSVSAFTLERCVKKWNKRV